MAWGHPGPDVPAAEQGLMPEKCRDCRRSPELGTRPSQNLNSDNCRFLQVLRTMVGRPVAVAAVSLTLSAHTGRQCTHRLPLTFSELQVAAGCV